MTTPDETLRDRMTGRVAVLTPEEHAALIRSTKLTHPRYDIATDKVKPESGTDAPAVTVGTADGDGIADTGTHG